MFVTLRVYARRTKNPQRLAEVVRPPVRARFLAGLRPPLKVR
ncbi:hypothetical protein [Deinococcus murrayi]|nr:hypothetical protein [Deinococcus murrayi]